MAVPAGGETVTARARCGGQLGQSTIEFAGMLTLLLIAGMFAWQLAMVGWTAVSAENAARTAARMASRGGDGVTAGKDSLATHGLQSNANVSVQGTDATVTVPIPIVFPGLQLLQLSPIQETAAMPYTG